MKKVFLFVLFIEFLFLESSLFSTVNYSNPIDPEKGTRPQYRNPDAVNQ